jgi:hypothetical protein
MIVGRLVARDLFAGEAISFVEPAPEIDEPTGERAERAVGVAAPDDRRAAGRTMVRARRTGFGGRHEAILSGALLECQPIDA